MNWRIKALTQRLLSAMPGGEQINDRLQLRLGGLRHFDEMVRVKVHNDWIVLAGHMNELGIRLEGRRYLEIGTGWFPTLPVCYFLAGAERVVTLDLHRHLSPQLTARMVVALRDHLPAIATAAQRPLAVVQAGHQMLVDQAARLAASGAGAIRDATDSLLSAARIDYQAPADAAATGLPAESVDVVFSNSVFEHVLPPAIPRLMQESRRILKRGGLAVHSVNCGDHYAYFDPQITAINYLQYTEQQWRFWNSDLQCQNRLRPQDFLAAAKAAGLELILVKHKPRADLLTALPRLKIAPEFQKYPPEQLCCTSLDFVARKP